MSAGSPGNAAAGNPGRADNHAGGYPEPHREPAAVLDGRSARARRTRQIIVDAHLALIGAGELKPTAKQVTARAGVSQRTLWDNFKDMESVMAASARRQLAEQDAAFEPIPVDLPLPERIHRYCAQRAVVLEAVAPLAQAADIQRPFSLVLQENLRQNLARIRAETERLFALELDRLDPAARSRAMLALITVSDWANWQLLRRYLGQSPDQAGAVLETALTGILRPAHTPGTEKGNTP